MGDLISQDAKDALLEEMGVSFEQVLFYSNKRKEGQYLLLSGLCLLLYDYFITLEEEWSFVWRPKPRFSFAKVLFFVNRYFPIVNTIVRWWVMTTDWESAELCQPGLSFTAYSAMVNFALVEIVLLLRVWVLYERKKPMGIGLLVLFIGAFGTALAIKVFQVEVPINFVPLAPQVLTRCKRTPASEVFWLYGIGLVVETVSFLLLIKKAYDAARESLQTPILTALLTHGAVYFGVVCAVLLITMISPLTHELYQPMADANYIVVITSIMCNRLILSLRGMAFTQGPIKASDMFDTSLRSRLEGDTMQLASYATKPKGEPFSPKSPQSPIQNTPGRIVATSYPMSPGYSFAGRVSEDDLHKAWTRDGHDQQELYTGWSEMEKLRDPETARSTGLSPPAAPWTQRGGDSMYTR